MATEKAAVTLTEIVWALKYGDATLEVVHLIFGGAGADYAVQAKLKGKKGGYGPLILPNEGETLGDVMKMLGDLIEHPEIAEGKE